MESEMNIHLENLKFPNFFLWIQMEMGIFLSIFDLFLIFNFLVSVGAFKFFVNTAHNSKGECSSVGCIDSINVCAMFNKQPHSIIISCGKIEEIILELESKNSFDKTYAKQYLLHQYKPHSSTVFYHNSQRH